MKLDVLIRPDGARTLRWIVALLVFAVVFSVRGYYVQHFANVLPFWDQWDAEGDQLLRPWINGDLRLAALWQLHNEHRIFTTRLTVLAIYIVSGTWSNLWEARINVGLAAATAAVFVWIAFRQPLPKGSRWLFVGTVVACYVLPFGWENFLVGFQSQFYYIAAFMLAAMILAAWRPESMAARCGVLVLCLVSIVTLASGLVTALAVAFAYGFAWHVRDRPMRPPLLFIAVLLGVAALGYLTVPHIAQHSALKSADALEFIDASSHVLGWPVAGYHWPGFWLWLPGAVMLPWMAWRRQASSTDLVMAGCYVWTVLQVLALAYGRGHGLLEVPSRYAELLIPGIIANAWFSLRFLGHANSFGQGRIVAGVVAAAFFVTLYVGFAMRLPGDIKAMRERHGLFEMQAANVVNYLQTRDPAALQRPFLQIPYPDATRLQGWLDDPVLSGSLPPVAPGVGKPAGVPLPHAPAN